MIFATSDLHGLELDKFKRLLEKVNFSEKDRLYILGDIIDRQNDGGIELLQWIMTQPNIEFICGNHESMLLACGFLFDMDLDASLDDLSDEEDLLLDNYIYNGGLPTIKALLKLRINDEAAFRKTISYLRDAPFYKKISVGDRSFLLCHAGLENFSTDKKIEEYAPDELLWTRPELDDVYFYDTMTVFGHTPTIMFGDEYNGKIVKTGTWIDIDVGVPYGNNPVILRLDDMKELYL